jgi:hypothetical protein
MIQGSELPFLSNWQNFYVIIGTGAATLTGLMFVATTLVAGIETQLSTLDAGMDAFNTPTFVHFCTVLLIALILSAPWQTFATLALLLGLVGTGGMIYLVFIMRRMRYIPNYQTPVKDWVWYMAFPLMAYFVLLVGAIALPGNPGLALYIMSAAMVALLFLGIHNAWDLVIYLAVARSHPDNQID